MNIDFKKLKLIICKCGSDKFNKSHHLHYVSKFASPTGEAGIINEEIFLCEKCEAKFDIKEFEKRTLLTLNKN